MKKELGVLLLALIAAIGFSGAIAAAPPNNNYNSGSNMNNNMNHGPNMHDHNHNHHWVVVWQGPWFAWTHSFWWVHFHSFFWWWHGHQYKVSISWHHGQRWVTLSMWS